LGSQKQDLHFTHALGNMLILVSILLVAASTAYFASLGIGLEKAYCEIFGNSIGSTILATMVFAGAALPLGDTTKERKARLRSLTNRSLASMFLVNLMLLPILGDLSNLQIFLALDAALLVTALASSALQLSSSTRSSVATAILEVAGSLLIVLAAVVQMFLADMLPMQIQGYQWAISLAAIAVGTVLLILSRVARKQNSDQQK